MCSVPICGWVVPYNLYYLKLIRTYLKNLIVCPVKKSFVWTKLGNLRMYTYRTQDVVWPREWWNRIAFVCGLNYKIFVVQKSTSMHKLNFHLKIFRRDLKKPILFHSRNQIMYVATQFLTSILAMYLLCIGDQR